ncbi:recombinase RecF [Leifsonia sp. Leaf325]|nr:DNA replication/repair protein RecF [Leifsonia sp. Leaf325]KQQ93518.1 recombinase RecF [Leifsonia sp. Leaf325]
MRIAHLSLTDYRNYERAEVSFDAGPTLIVGRNGQGKTNLVEAIGYLATLSSHRVSNDQPLIRAGRDAAIIRARLQSSDRELLAELQINRVGANRAQLNRGVVKPRELVRYCHSVLFAPEDIALVRGEPSGRRRFLDELLVQRIPRMAGVMSDYERVVRQRNTLLKSARASGLRDAKLSTLDIWDERLVVLGSEIIAERLNLIDRLQDPLRAAYQSVAGDDQVPRLVPALSIDGSGAGEEGDISDAVPSETGSAPRGASVTEIASRFRDMLARLRGRELDRAITLVGPHRDDIVLMLNALPAKGYASHGESWSYALALKLASAELLRHDFASGDPVLILDDVFAELDQARRRRLADAVTGYEQVLITAAVLDDVPEALAGTVVRIRAGEVVDA